uniref:Tc3 transposase DNA binding domain-containing protein n=1 Tax=Globisporangium ultimum (strain ATCC 200006 / CBS 805.95 / DAOM BR144) TaxID=431595 RepID=K3WAF6_GLOUD
MAGGTKLTTVEQGQIQVLKAQKLSFRAITKTIARSKTVVENFLKDRHYYASKKRAERVPKLSERDRRAILCHVTINKSSS